MRVKIIEKRRRAHGEESPCLEDRINEFIADKEVMDIKIMYGYGGREIVLVLIMYKE